MKVAVVGGGVIGLTIAYRLAQRGVSVSLFDQQKLGQESSWAGAGILPPANNQDPTHPLEHLQSLSNLKHQSLSKELLELTGIDNELRQCGGIYLATTNGEAAALLGTSHLWRKQGIEFESVDPQTLSELEPGLAHIQKRVKRSLFVKGESQIRNPNHLQALVQACRLLGVRIEEHLPITSISSSDCSASLRSLDSAYEFDAICVAAGAWSSKLLGEYSKSQVVPVKGHMLLFKFDRQSFQSIINEGSRYIVSRLDGHVLVGSSEEETGFDKSTSEVEIWKLMEFAKKISPQFCQDNLLRTWTGLRPMSYDHLPYIGRHSKFTRIFIATGHFRSGLQLSTGTAEVISKLILGEQVNFDLQQLRPER